MSIQKGSRVLVNVAPFIASLRRGKDAVPCRVLSVTESAVEVATEYPYRELSMWVSSTWIEELLDTDLPAAHDAAAPDADCNTVAFHGSTPHKRSSLQPA
jgi:hypothetical protein